MDSVRPYIEHNYTGLYVKSTRTLTLLERNLSSRNLSLFKEIFDPIFLKFYQIQRARRERSFMLIGVITQAGEMDPCIVGIYLNFKSQEGENILTKPHQWSSVHDNQTYLKKIFLNNTFHKNTSSKLYTS